VLRGGTWLVYGNNCRSAARACVGPELRSYTHGFRVAG